MEQSRGWLAYVARARSATDQLDAYERLARHLETYRRLIVLDYGRAAADYYQRLRTTRVNVKPLDLRIALITLANHAILLSRNLKDCEKIPGLSVENWLNWMSFDRHGGNVESVQRVRSAVAVDQLPIVADRQGPLRSGETKRYEPVFKHL